MDPPNGFAHAFLKIEGSSDPLECWFNPTEYTVAKQSTWTATPVAGQALPPVQYGGGQPRTLSLELFFDDSDAPDGDVRGVVDALFTLVEVDEATGSSTEKNSGRPPMVEFGWGAASTFKAVVTSLSATYQLFRANGVPVRAKVNVDLMQTERAVASGAQRGRRSQNPTTRGIRGIRSTRLRDGDSLQSIAYREYGDATLWRVIAAGNGIDDPMRLRRGAELSVPRLPE
jgi:hypothetical protein